MANILKELGYVTLDTNLGKMFCPVYKVDEFGNILMTPCPAWLKVEGSVMGGWTCPIDYPDTQPVDGWIGDGSTKVRIKGKSGTYYNINCYSGSDRFGPYHNCEWNFLANGFQIGSSKFYHSGLSYNVSLGVCAFYTIDGTRFKMGNLSIGVWLTSPSTNGFAPYTITLPETDKFGYVTAHGTGVGQLGAFAMNLDDVDAIVMDIIQGGTYHGPDPYQPGGFTDPDGEEGANPEAEWEIPNVTPSDQPSGVNDLGVGLYRCYAMTESELATFGAKLWRPSVLQSLRNRLQQPLDLIMGLKSYPFEINAGEAVEIAFNWVDDIDPIWGSGVYGHPISGNGMQTITFGHIDVPRYSGTFYDYQPFSSAQLHLPYIGFVPLKMNEIVGKSLLIKYVVDLLSGDLTAWVTMGTTDDYDNNYNLKVYGYYQGNIAKPIPLMQQDLWQVYKKGAEVAFNAAAAIGTLASGSLVKATGEFLADMPFTGKGAKLRREAGQEAAGEGDALISEFKRRGTQAVNSAIEMSYVSSPIDRNGYLDGSSGRTSSQQCFLIITVPDQCVPENQFSMLGAPTNIPGPLSKVSGYTEVKDIRLHSGIASEYELAELEGILRGGIIV